MCGVAIVGSGATGPWLPRANGEFLREGENMRELEVCSGVRSVEGGTRERGRLKITSVFRSPPAPANRRSRSGRAPRLRTTR
ncbi:unnamed protein product [Leptosia nina]|uniref:Uncharacterized protein n=1 Tax=Leptosia nina TaxID=320188 RepID=A0AAV1K0J1_9NEOP